MWGLGWVWGVGSYNYGSIQVGWVLGCRVYGIQGCMRSGLLRGSKWVAQIYIDMACWVDLWYRELLKAVRFFEHKQY